MYKMFDRMTGWWLGTSDNLPVSYDGCLDLCSLSARQRSSSPHKNKVNDIKTVSDITQSNNTPVRSETHFHWPSNIQKQNLTDEQDGHSSRITSGQAGPHNVYMTVSPQSSFAVNCYWSEWHESRPWNISLHQEMYRLSNGFQVWMTLTTAGGVFTDGAISNIERFQ